MVELGSAFLRVEYPYLSDEEMTDFASVLFESSEAAAADFLSRLGPVEVWVEVEEGSLKARTHFTAVGRVVVAGIIGYGGLRTGIDYLARDLKRAEAVAVQQTVELKNLAPERVIRVRRSATLPDQMRRVLRSVERGEMDSEEANRRLLELLEAESLPQELDQEVARELDRIGRRSPPPVEAVEQPSILAVPPGRPLEQEAPRPPRSRDPQPPEVPRKVEVRREGPDREKRVRRNW